MTEPITEFIWYCGTLTGALSHLNLTAVVRAMQMLDVTCAHGQTIFIIGNGGSAATASHFAADLNKLASVGREPRFRAMALADNVPGLTAWANDVEYKRVFANQLQNFGRENDLLVVISTSGQSPNLLEAIIAARALKMQVISMVGNAESEAAKLADIAIHTDAPKQTMQEDVALILCHALAENL